MLVYRSLVLALSALAASTFATGTASAQDIFSFLWGGGSREVISFTPNTPRAN